MTDGVSSSRGVYMGTAGGFAAILLWSTSIAFTRSISEQIGPVTGAGFVYSISAVLGLIGVFRSSRERKKLAGLPPRYLLGCGALFVGYMLCLFLAIGMAKTRSQVVEVGLINYLWPALTLLLSVPILGTRARWLLLPGTALALFGVFFVLAGGADHTWQAIIRDLAANPIAYVLAFAAAIAWALYSTLTRRWVGDGKAAGGAVPFFLAATALVMFGISFFKNEPRVWNPHVIMEVLILGGITFFAYSLWDNAMRRGNTILVAAGSYLTPLFSTLVSCVYLAVPPTSTLWMGCGFLICGSLLSWLSIETKKTPRVPSSRGMQPPTAIPPMAL